MSGHNIDVAVVGCGWAGQRHARAFSQCGAQVRWAVDVNQDRAQGLLAGLNAFTNEAERLHGRASTDFREALADPTVDAVVICLPHDLHAPVAVECAHAGKHVLCEKPIADSLAAADYFRLSLNRDADGSAITDSATGDAYILAIELRDAA